MQRTSYTLSVPLLATLALVLLGPSPVQAQTTLDEPLWTVSAGDVPWLTTSSSERGGAYNPATDHILVASAQDGGAKPNIAVVDAEDGTALRSLDITDVEGGTFTMSQVAVTTDGQIFATNFTRDAASTDDGPAKVYYWSSEDAVPVVAYSGDPSDGDADANNRQFGEGLGVSGTGSSVKVYLSGNNNSQLATFTWDGQTATDPTLITVGDDTPSDGASDGIAAVPGNDSELWVNGIDEPISKIDATNGSFLTRIPATLVDFSYDGLAVAEIDGRMLLAAGPGNLADQDQTFRVIDVTDPDANSLAYVTESIGATADNETRSGFVAFDTARDNLIVFSTNNALASYPLAPDAADFEATLAGYNEVGPAMTDASGDVSVTLAGNTLTVSGEFSGLSSALIDVAGTPAHIHVGSADENGPVVIKLVVDASSDNLSGSFDDSVNMFDLSALTYPDGVDMDSVVSAIGNGNAYVNVHTENFPGGEIRGQILASPNAAPTAASILTPDDAAAVTVTGAPDQAFDVDWEDATDPDGDEVVYVWQLATDANFNNVVFETNTGTDSELSTDFGAVDGILAGAGVDVGAAAVTLYHRANAQDGSLRTTGDSKTVLLTRGSVEFDLEANLAGFNEVGENTPIQTSASGSATATLVGNTLTLSGEFSDLSSALMEVAGTPAHIHLAATGENGPIVIPLTVNAADDNLSGTFDVAANTFDLATLSYPDDIDLNAVRSALTSGNAYVNIHTANFTAGELRGQLLSAGNTAPSTVSIESPADGAEVTISGGGSQSFTADWGDATDAEGNKVIYVWQLAADADFNTIVFQTNTGTESEFTTDFYTVDDLLDGADVAAGDSITLYHRANAQDGSLRAEGTTASVVLIRGTDPLPVEEETGLPERFTIDGNYPNPFNPSTSIRFDLPSAANVSVKVFDVMGREVMTVPARTFSAGARQELRLDAVSLSSGTYFYRITAQMGGETEMKTGKMVLLK